MPNLEEEQKHLVRDHLRKVLASSSFSRAANASALLEYLVAQKLDGAENLKERVIGIKVFARQPDWDPKLDTTVRTEARRVRQKLAQFYESPAAEAGSPIIELPVGTYVPLFHLPVVTAGVPGSTDTPQGIATPAVLAQDHKATLPHGQKVLWLGIAVFCCLFAGFAVARRNLVIQASAGVFRTVPFSTEYGQQLSPAISPDANQIAYVADGTVAQALRPFPQYGFIATDCCLQNVGHSSYEALIASVERRFAQGLNLQASYTWSKTITNADSALPGINGGVQQIQDPFNSKSQKSLSIQDIPNTFVTSFIYELPFGKGKSLFNFNNPFARSLISGFEIGSVLRYQSGQPTSFGGATGIPGWDNFIAYNRIPGSQLASNARRGHIDPFRALKSGFTTVAPDPNVDSEFNGWLVPNGIATNANPNPGPVNAKYKALQNSPAFIDQNIREVRIQRAVRSSIVNGNQTNCETCDDGAFQLGNVPRVTGELRNYRYNNEDFSFLKKHRSAKALRSS